MNDELCSKNLGPRGAAMALVLGAFACTPSAEIGRSERAVLSTDRPIERGPLELGPSDDAANCVDWGRVTYENTIADVLDRNCVKCHAPRKGSETRFTVREISGKLALPTLQLESVREKWAVSPQDPPLSTWSRVEGYIGLICYFAVRQADTQARMPPVGSEAALDPEDLEALEAWCDAYDALSSDDYTTEEKAEYARGSQVPEIDVTDASRASRLSDVTVRYVAHDEDSSGATVALFYDTDKEGFDGETIAGCEPTSARASDVETREEVLLEREYTWDTSGLDRGTYYVYACVFDGETAACDYADDPIQVFRTTIRSW